MKNKTEITAEAILNKHNDSYGIKVKGNVVWKQSALDAMEEYHQLKLSEQMVKSAEEVTEPNLSKNNDGDDLISWNHGNNIYNVVIHDNGEVHIVLTQREGKGFLKFFEPPNVYSHIQPSPLPLDLEDNIENILLSDVANLQDEDYKEQVEGAVDSIMQLILPHLKQSPNEAWVSVDIKPTIEKEYVVIYNHGEIGKLHYWRGYWANGNVDVSNDITHWMPLPTIHKPTNK